MPSVKIRPLAVLLVFPLLAQERSADYSLVHQIRQEAYEHSQVMDTLAFLTDRYGPRLASSPEFDEAADWAMKRLSGWGLSNVHAESWGPFGRTWSLKHLEVEMIEPRYSQLNAMPLAWSEPTGKPLTADVVLAPFSPTPNQQKKTEEDFAKYTQEWHGRLKGKVVLFNKPHTSSLGTNPALHRYTDAELANMTKAPDAGVPKIDIRLEDVKIPEDPEEAGRYVASLPNAVRTALQDRNREAGEKRDQWFVQEGVAALFLEDTRSHEGMVFAEQAGTRKAADHLSRKFRITEEQYNRMARLVEKNEQVKVRIDLEAAVGDRDVNAKNLVAEIPGGAKKDEVVMIGAHFDSWHGATGATDNAAGSAVMMEVMRVLNTLRVKMDRTVRLALWSGEEEGLLGSKAYVKEHFGDPDTMVLSGEHAKLAAYFNLDNGSGRIRGVYLQDNDAARPFFERAFVPLRDPGVTTISIRNTGGTDHLSFDAVGLAGFQFIQDPLDYMTITHHSSMDTYDHLIPEDLKQASLVIASIVAMEANAPEMMPRKPLPAASR
ncbi:MAG TPA: M20/M25/M40 family metallo-hydrolase [Bryobacteraceae bacterium]|nr:M20/M25/M40 family metallo-hydrolase [Bryobacteraceae bacterium]